jgi:hypothetical protein
MTASTALAQIVIPPELAAGHSLPALFYARLIHDLIQYAYRDMHEHPRRLNSAEVEA